MIVISKARLRFLRAGRTLTIADESGRYRRGREYAVGLSARASVCRVEVVDVTAHSIRIRIALEPPRLLAARSEYGYTSDPMKALRDEMPADAPPPEFVDQLTAVARSNHAVFRAEELRRAHDRSLAIRLRAALRVDDIAELQRVQAELTERIASSYLPHAIESAQPARRSDGFRSTIGRGPSYAFNAGSAVA